MEYVLDINPRAFNAIKNGTKIVTICGSMKFKDEMKRIALKLELKEKFIVWQPVYEITDGNLSEEDIKIIQALHFKRIKMSDAIFVVNVNNYIGESTKKEIEYAKSLNKEIMYLN